MRVGVGYDAHRLEKHRRLILGGVEIKAEYGLIGHSDADVLVHAIMDALLGALALGDIGKHFPNTNETYKDISSIELLCQVYKTVTGKGYKIVNIDSIIIAQRPRIAPYTDEMRKNIAKCLNTDISDISIKATTEENMGFTGREEGISAKAICLIEKII